MLAPDSLEIETVYASTIGRGLRVVGLCPAEREAGAAQVAPAIAARAARGGLATVLVDLTSPPCEGGDGWTPGDGGARSGLRRDPAGFDRLVCRPDPRAAYGLREARLLRRLFEEDLAGHAAIVVEAAPFSEAEAAAVPTAIAAASCDAVLVVCATGRTDETMLAAMMEALKVTDATVAGLVLNEGRPAETAFDLPPVVLRFLRRPAVKAVLVRFRRRGRAIGAAARGIVGRWAPRALRGASILREFVRRARPALDRAAREIKAAARDSMTRR